MIAERNAATDLTVDVVGNALCLDFTNTVNARPSPDRDLLASPEGFNAWLEAVELDGHQLPDVDPATLASLREFRDVVYSLFVGVLGGQLLPQEPLTAVMERYALAVPSASWHRVDDRLAPEFSVTTPSQVAGAIAASAAQLLQDGPLSRLGQCPSCGWLFLDTSRNGQRRWCSMATCGSRDKSSRYFDRAKRSVTHRVSE